MAEEAGARWRAGGRPVVGVCAGGVSIAVTAAYGLPWLRPFVERSGAVRADLPLGVEILRLPASAFLPTAELPVAAAAAQLVLVLGLGELLLGRGRTLAMAAGAHVGCTMLVRQLLRLGPVPVIGLPADQAHLLDTGPSVMTAAVGAWLLVRARAWWALALLVGSLMAAAISQNDMDGHEHLAAVLCGALIPPSCAAVVSAARRSRTWLQSLGAAAFSASAPGAQTLGRRG